MEKIVLAQFRTTTRFDAAHIIDENARIVAYVAEPESRNGKDWDEIAFRAAVEAEVSAWEARITGEKLYIQYDPGRDNATTVDVRLHG